MVPGFYAITVLGWHDDFRPECTAGWVATGTSLVDSFLKLFFPVQVSAPIAFLGPYIQTCVYLPSCRRTQFLPAFRVLLLTRTACLLLPERFSAGSICVPAVTAGVPAAPVAPS